MKFAALILAGGSSSRMSSDKQLLTYKGKSLLRHTAEMALNLKAHKIICVTGHLKEKLEQSLSDLNIEYVHNINHKQGMSTSLVAGLKSIQSNDDISGVLIMLCDQPLIPLRHYRDLINIAAKETAQIVVTRYDKKSFGAPSYFTQSLFKELVKLKTSESPKHVIKNHLDSTNFVICEKALFDIDTDDDYVKLNQGS